MSDLKLFSLMIFVLIVTLLVESVVEVLFNLF